MGSSSEHTPFGCLAGGSGDIPTHDYCYAVPSSISALADSDGALQNWGGEGCTPDNPCGPCQGDCDNDNDCEGNLKCWFRDSSDSTPSGCLAGGSGDIPTHDYCYESEPASGRRMLSDHVPLVN